MKIFICSLSNWNVINFRKNLIIKLLNMGNEVYVLSKKDKYNLDLNKLGCKTININFNNRSFNILNDFFVLLNIFYFTIKLKPKIFLTFNLKPNILSKLISCVLRKKNILTITGIGDSFSKDTNIMLRIAIKYLYKLLISKNDIVIFQNQKDLDYFLKNRIIKNENNYKVFPGSGVNIDYFAYKPVMNNSTITFTYIGRLLKSKGINTFLECINKYYDLDSKYKNIKFNVVGNYKNIKDFNYDLFKKLNNQKNIKFFGFVKDVRQIIYDSDCIVLPSFREGTSKALLESLSCGRPIITSDVPGCSHLVNNFQNGYLCKKNDPYSLNLAINDFLNLNDNTRVKMSKKSRLFVENFFDEKKVINKYTDLII